MEHKLIEESLPQKSDKTAIVTKEMAASVNGQSNLPLLVGSLNVDPKTLNCGKPQVCKVSEKQYAHVSLKKVVSDTIEEIIACDNVVVKAKVKLASMIVNNNYEDWIENAGGWSKATHYKCVCGANYAGPHNSRKGCTPRTQCIAYYNALCDLGDFQFMCPIVDSPTINEVEINVLKHTQPIATSSKFSGLEDECDKTPLVTKTIDIVDSIKTVNKCPSIKTKTSIANTCCKEKIPHNKDFVNLPGSDHQQRDYGKPTTTDKVVLPGDLELDQVGDSLKYNIFEVEHLLQRNSISGKVSSCEPMATNQLSTHNIIYKPLGLRRLFTKKSQFDPGSKFNHKTGALMNRKDCHEAGIEVVPDEMCIPALYKYLRRHEFEQYKDRAAKLAHMTKLAVKFDIKLDSAFEINKYFATIQKVTDSKDTVFMLSEVNPLHSRSRFRGWLGKLTRKHFQ